MFFQVQVCDGVFPYQVSRKCTLIVSVYKTNPENFDTNEFAKRLWGDIFYNQATRKFKSKSEDFPRSFVHFILEPIYKLYTQVIGEDEATLKETLSSLGIYLKNSQLTMDIEPLLTLVLLEFFGDASGLIDVIVSKLPSPITANSSKVDLLYTGDSDSTLSLSMRRCDPRSQLMIHIVKMYNSDNVTKFSCFGRIMSGTLTVGQDVRVMGEGYTPDDEEDMSIQNVSAIYIYQTRYKIPVSSISAGNWVLIDGIDSNLIKTGTVTDLSNDDPVYIFKPLRFNTVSVMKVSVEPINPSELPKMLDGLRKVNKSFCILNTRVEESGEHVLLGTGEMYLDCVLHDLRKLYSEIDIKVADPVVKFCETVVEGSSLKCFAETPNKKYF